MNPPFRRQLNIMKNSEGNQRKSEVEQTKSLAEQSREDSIEEWAPLNYIDATKNPNSPPPVTVRTSPGPAWDFEQVLKAARLLFKPPMPVEFADEQEMRYVYSIIYDVFRYKTILDQALADVSFYSDYPKFMQFRQTTWLFIMELARRRWAARPRGEQEQIKLMLEQAGYPFCDIEKAVWDQRVHFAAAIARIRIQNKAFTLSEMLPAHLREEKVSACVHKETFTGWVNTFKAKKMAPLVRRLHDLGYTYSSSRILCAGEYRFDRVCPRFITIRPLPDVRIGQTDLVKDGIIVLQEREFCEGASTLCRALRQSELRGAVAQTHANSPRSSAYLAAQLHELAAVLRAKTPAAPATPDLGKLLVFGAGDNVENYVQNLKHLGIDASVAPPDTDAKPRVCVFSEAIHCDTPVVSSALDDVGRRFGHARGPDRVRDRQRREGPCSRNTRRTKKTLKTLLSKPQIQLILYETHSALEAENQAQVTRAVAEANRMARERHSLLKKKHREPSSAKSKEQLDVPVESTISMDDTISRSDISVNKSDDNETTLTDSDVSSPKKIKPMSDSKNEFVLRKNPDLSEKKTSSRPNSSKARPIPEVKIPETGETVPRDPDKDSADVVVPNCDLFEIGKLPMLGNGLDINYILGRDGCYLGLIQRKEITRLDAKYMIQVAEERGLFGAASAPPVQSRRKKETTATPRRRRRKHSGFEVERVAAPTHASMVRAARRVSAPAGMPLGVNLDAEPTCVCERHLRRQAAASALSAAACTCDARHRPYQQRRRASLDAGTTATPQPPVSPSCRRPFPLAVHDVKLYPAHKVGAS
ncbi:hypothetical protein NE865_10057 [Phthorimaea operculella]|nr:hypothetical protein NE865_10057 [Phthorimaea operculella]